MNPIDEDDEESRDAVDLGALSRVGTLMGAYLAMAGILGEHPVLRAMAESYTMEPALTPGQTLGLGLALIAASVATKIAHVIATKRRT
jgi:hypothetical protein